MATISSLVVELVLQADNFNAGLKDSQRQIKELDKIVKPMKQALSDLGSAMTGVGVAISAVGVPFAFLAQKAIDNADNLRDMAKGAGSTVEALSALQLQAELSGTSLDSVEVAMKKANVTIENAASGGKAAAESLAKIGLSAEQLLAMKPEDRFFAIAQGVAQIEDPSLRAGVAVEVLGKSATDIIPMLDGLAGGQAAVMKSASDLGRVISTDAANAADAFNDSVTNLTSAVMGLVNSIISSGLLDDLTGLINTVASVTAEFGKAHPIILAVGGAIAAAAAVVGPLVAGFGLMLSGISGLIPVVTSIIGYLGGGAGLAGVISTVAAIITGPVGIVIAIGAAATALGVYLSKNQEVVAAVSAIWKTWGPTFTALFNGVWTAIKSTFTAVWDAIKGVLSGALDVIKGVIQVFAGVTTGNWTLFTKGLENIWRGLWEAIKSIILGPINAVKGSVTGLTEGITGAFKTMYDKVVGHSYVPDLIDAIKDQFGRLPDVMVDPVGTATKNVTGNFSSMFDLIVSAAKDWKGTLLGVVKDVADNLLSGSGLGGALKKIPGLGGILGGGGAAGGAAGAGGGASGGLSSILGASPWGALAQGVGGFLGTFLSGLGDDTQKNIEKWSGWIFTVLKDTLEQVLWPQYGLIAAMADAELWTQLIPEIGYWATQVANVTAQWGAAIVEALGNIATGGGGGGGDEGGAAAPDWPGGGNTIPAAQGAPGGSRLPGNLGSYGAGGLATFGLLAGIPSFDTETPMITKSGLAIVHEGEEIRRAGGGVHITINVAGSVTSEHDLAKRIMAEMSRLVEKGSVTLTASRGRI